MAIAIDTLEYSRLLIDAGVEQKQAEVQASFLNKTLKEHAVSKEELRNTKEHTVSKEELRNTIEQTKTELATKSGVDRSIETAKIAINAKIDKETSELKSDIEKVEAKINLIEEKLSSEIRLTRWMVGFCISLLVVVIGLILAPYIK